MQQKCRIQSKFSIWAMDVLSVEKGRGQEEDVTNFTSRYNEEFQSAV